MKNKWYKDIYRRNLVDMHIADWSDEFLSKFNADDYYKNLEDAYYLCEAEGGSSYKIIIRDCLIENKQNFIAGDAITVWGECDEEKTVYSMSSENYAEWEAPCVNVAYAAVE